MRQTEIDIRVVQDTYLGAHDQGQYNAEKHHQKL